MQGFPTTQVLVKLHEFPLPGLVEFHIEIKYYYNIYIKLWEAAPVSLPLCPLPPPPPSKLSVSDSNCGAWYVECTTITVR